MMHYPVFAAGREHSRQCYFYGLFHGGSFLLDRQGICNHQDFINFVQRRTFQNIAKQVAQHIRVELLWFSQGRAGLGLVNDERIYQDLINPVLDN